MIQSDSLGLGQLLQVSSGPGSRTCFAVADIPTNFRLPEPFKFRVAILHETDPPLRNVLPQLVPFKSQVDEESRLTPFDVAF